MVGHALWLVEFPKNFHEDVGKYLMAFHQLFCGGVSSLHPHLQQELGGTLATYSRGFAHFVTTQDICKFGKMLLRYGQGLVPRLHC
jgi:hypothetical protein